ncbi:hypothetical protein [Azospirillum sp. sgz301742]
MNAEHRDGTNALISGLSALRALSRRERHWTTVVGVLRPALETGAWKSSYHSESAFLAAVSQASGYSRTMLQRAVRADAFAQRLATEGHAPLERIVGLPFGIVEELASIDAHSPELAHRMLARALEGEMTLGELRKVHQESVASLAEQRPGKIAGRRLLLDLERRIVQALIANPSAFVAPPVRIVAVDTPLGRGGCDAIATRIVHGVLETIAFEVKVTSRSADAGHLLAIMPQVALASSFHTDYWVLSNAGERELREFATEIGELSLANVGLATVRDEGGCFSFRPTRRPSGLPTPDRRLETIRMLGRAGLNNRISNKP